MTERLIEVRLHETIKLEKARKFWIKNFANKQELKWDDFAKKFQPLQAATPEQTKMQTMMFLQKGERASCISAYSCQEPSVAQRL